MKIKKASLRDVDLNTLPEEITQLEAFKSEHHDVIVEACSNLRRGRSVLFSCERRDSEFLIQLVHEQMKTMHFSPILIDGSRGGNPLAPTGIARMLEQIEAAKTVTNNERPTKNSNSKFEVIPHLDTMTSLNNNASMTDLARNLIVHLTDTSIPLMGIVEPKSIVPATILEFFPNKFHTRGIRRETLPRITKKSFALRLNGDKFDALAFHSYVSGMSIADFIEMQDAIIDGGHPELLPGQDESKKIYKLIHKNNMTSKFESPSVKFSDIAGYDEVKKKLEDEVFVIKRLSEDAEDEAKYDELSDMIPRGMIFEGPPGTGKTLFAKAIATVFGANLTIVSASSLMNMWVGESERGIREVFEAARKQTPAVIVFDEIDSFASQRGNDAGGGGVKHSMVNTLLTEMDGFANNKGVFVVATTNFIEAIDSALLRPGRFNLKITIPAPSSEDRTAILNFYRRKFKLHKEVTDEIIQHAVESTEGLADYRKGLPFTGDHLANLMKGLNRILIRKRVEGVDNYTITHKDVTSTLNPAYMKKIELSEHEKITIAIHECGHAIMALYYPSVGKITEIEISQTIPGALGYVKRTKPENDKSMTRDQFRMLCRILFGGKAAEEVIFGDGNHSIGVAADLRNASQIVEAMHYAYGMSESGIVPSENPSHSIRTRIENEIANLLKVEYEATKNIIRRNLKLLRQMSEDLLKTESIRDVSIYKPVDISKNDELYLGVKNVKTIEEAFEE